jgi:hypothetical protein
MKLWRFGFLIAVLACGSYAQKQELSRPYKKWLFCDVDFLFSQETVGADFSLKVSFKEAPVAWARMSLVRGGVEWKPGDGEVVATAETDSTGTAEFSAIAPGSYTPRAEDGLLFPGNEFIHVKAGLRPGEAVKVFWPGLTMAVRSLRGRLTTSREASDEGVPWRDGDVELLELHTGRLIESTHTYGDGSYGFATEEPGLYVFRVTMPARKKGNMSESHDLAVELDPSAKEGAIPEMKVIWSECEGVQLLRRKADGWEAE